MESDKIKNLLRPDRVSHFKNRWSKPQNVVVIILESFALEFVGAANEGQGFTPFFDRLASKGLLYKNGFANGRRSIEAIPAILSSIPSLMNEAFLTSSYQGIELHGMGNILKRQGYSTAFFHGAANGSMFFDSYTSRLGFEKYYGLNEYPDREYDYDGFWGIFDEPFFQFFARELNQFKQPFAASIFSLSSHQPFTLPEKYRSSFKKGSLPIHATIQYADLALEKFFATAEKQHWYNDTLFVITGDHTSLSDQKNYQSDKGYYRVPILFYHPQIMEWPQTNLNRPCQHIDILPSVLDIIDQLDYAEKQLSWLGGSVFSSDKDTFVVNRTVDSFWYLSGEEFRKINHDFQVVDPKNLDSSDPHLARLIAYLQYFINGVIENKIYREN